MCWCGHVHTGRYWCKFLKLFDEEFSLHNLLLNNKNQIICFIYLTTDLMLLTYTDLKLFIETVSGKLKYLNFLNFKIIYVLYYLKNTNHSRRHTLLILQSWNRNNQLLHTFVQLHTTYYHHRANLVR